jgi:hypothetical protein
MSTLALIAETTYLQPSGNRTHRHVAIGHDSNSQRFDWKSGGTAPCTTAHPQTIGVGAETQGDT